MKRKSCNKLEEFVGSELVIHTTKFMCSFRTTFLNFLPTDVTKINKTEDTRLRLVLLKFTLVNNDQLYMLMSNVLISNNSVYSTR